MLLREVLDFLVERGWMDLHKGFCNREDGSGKMTRIIGKGCIREALGGMYEEGDSRERVSKCFTITSRKISYPPFERQLTHVVHLRDEDKRRCSYDETRWTEAMKLNLERYNRSAKGHWLDLLVTDQEFPTVLDGMSQGERREVREELGQDWTGDQILDLSRTSLYRVFNVSFDHGGRFYGGWWQGVPQAYRPFITIGGQPTRELDYKGIHLYMLYAKRGIKYEGDPYTLDGVDPQYRKLIKLTLMKMINAPPGRTIRRPTGKGAIVIDGSKRKVRRRPGLLPLPPGFTWKGLQEAIVRKHPTIAEFFRSGEGIRLQRKDSDIAEAVMVAMMERGILVLPIHDSFLVDYRYAETLRKEMSEGLP